jgi:hypothetical protein
MTVILQEDERQLLRRLITALRPFQELNERGVSLSIVLAFLSVAIRDGLTLGEHAEAVGLNPSPLKSSPTLAMSIDGAKRDSN